MFFYENKSFTIKRIKWCGKEDIANTFSFNFKQLMKRIGYFQRVLVIRSKDEIVDGLLLIVPGKHSNMYRFITVSKATFWNHVVRKFVKKSYPEFM